MFSNGEEKIRFDIVASEQVYLRRKEVYWHRSSLEARNAEVSEPISLQWVGERGGGGGEGIPFLSYVSQIYPASKKNHVLKTVFNFYFWVKIHLS